MKVANVLKEIAVIASIIFILALVMAALTNQHMFSIMTLICFAIAVLCSCIVESIEKKYNNMVQTGNHPE